MTQITDFKRFFRSFRAYEPGTQCYQKILEVFGQDLKAEDGKIDRRKLGAKVFSDPESLNKLQQIVWPEILKQANEQIAKFHENGVKVVILDAAVLLQAGWNSEVHEIWGVFIGQVSHQRLFSKNWALGGAVQRICFDCQLFAVQMWSL